MQRLFEFTGKKALVTGASRGIGRAIALALAEAGADVGVHFHQRAAAAEEVTGAIRDLGRHSCAAPADMTQPDQVEGMVRSVERELGPIEILVLNAGVSRAAFVLDVDAEEFKRVMDANVRGPFVCARAVIPGMMQRGWGRIITISSNVAKAPTRDMAPHYTASKAALVGLMRSLAMQLAPYGITVNDVAPGPTNTENSTKWTPEQLRASAQRIPLGRRGEAEDITGAVVFLASEAAAWITGASIDVNGGVVMG